jgi:hypothetical protein
MGFAISGRHVWAARIRLMIPKLRVGHVHSLGDNGKVITTETDCFSNRHRLRRGGQTLRIAAIDF